jgi:magnesium transporter
MIRAWEAGEGGGREIAPDEAVRLARAGGTGAIWIDLDCEEPAAARAVIEPLGIHPLALEDMVTQVNRPKVDDYGGYLYIAVHTARWEHDMPSLREIDILISERYLITYHDGATRPITAAHETLARRAELLGRGPAHLLHFILDLMVDNYLPIMDKIAGEIDELEEDVLHGGRRRVNARILRLKRGMAAMRRIIGPQRDTILALTRDEFRAIPAPLRPYLRDVFDRLARVSDLMESYREEVSGLLELTVAMTSTRLNEVIKVLTVFATIMLPLTVITSYYGMNFRFAEYEFKYATAYVLALLTACALGTWWLLRRNRWL